MRGPLVVGVALVALLGPGPPAAAQDLDRELQKLNGLRKGRETPLAAVDQLGAELLRKYPDPKSQGQIYYQLAHVYAQSGLVQPERTIDYAKKALEFPLEPAQRLRLHVYWGDARQVANPREPFVAKRREAVRPYLEGLKETLKYELPEKPPELPPVFKFDAEPQQGPVYDKLVREHRQALAARRRAELQGELIMHRDVLTGQIAGLYSRRPFDPDELEQLASSVLDDPAAVARLKKAVEAAVAKVPPAKTPELPPAERPAGSPGRLILLIGSAAALGAVTLVLLLRNRPARPSRR
jgi:hypothetical protein